MDSPGEATEHNHRTSGVQFRGSGAKRNTQEIVVAFDTQTIYGTRRGTALAAFAAMLACPIASGMLPAALAVGSSMAIAQPEAGDRSAEELLANFVHFVKIARFDVAAGEATALLASGISDVDFVELVDGSGDLDRFQSAVAQAMRVDEVQGIATELDALYRSGRLKRARDPDEISRNIKLLNGTVGERLHARSRLVSAGEYAAPQLLDALLGGGGAAQRATVQQVLIQSGRQAVSPLSEALLGLEQPAAQERILNVLAAIRYPASLPAIVSVYNSTDSPAVRAEAVRAIESLGGSRDASPAYLFADLAEGYYAHREELTSFPGEDYQLSWAFDPAQGLTMRAVASEIYHETMSMRMAERSLRLDPSSQETLALWIASAFRREIESEGLEHVAEAAAREAMYFAVASGPETSQRILARAIDNRDTPLAMRAIEAIQQTAGVDSLTGIAADRRPLIEALGFHSRRVQVDAALAIAGAHPTSEFDGSERVVPILASAIRNAGERFAIVLTGADREEYDRVRDLLDADGYTVLPPAERGIKDLAAAISDAPGIDLIVVSLDGERSISAHDEARAEPRLSAAPLMLLARSADTQDLTRRYNRDRTVMVRRDRISSKQFANAVDKLVGQALGGKIGDAEAHGYSTAALNALRDLAVGNNTILRVEDAAMPLINAINDATGQQAMDIAEVLSYVRQPRAQVALMDAALDADGTMQIDLLDRVAASARRFGNMLETRQVSRILELAGSPSDDTAIAAATVTGALSLSNAELVPLITGGADASEPGGL